MKSKAFVLLSGGIDSTVCLYQAKQDFGHNVEAISIFYGQRHMREIEYARKSADALHVVHRIINLASIVPKSMLTDKMAKIPEVSYADIEGVSPAYVPFRNGLLLSAVASIVHGEYVDAREKEEGDLSTSEIAWEKWPEWAIYFGAHAEDAQAWAYADCTPEFIGAMANAIWVGTYRAIRLHTPLQWTTKKEIILKGEQYGVRWDHTWSCYSGKMLHCGVCPTCRARRAGFAAADVSEPTDYECEEREVAAPNPRRHAIDADDEIPF